jgi:hypothetical protein
MGHFELLPEPGTITEAMRDAGMTPDQQQAVLETMAYVLNEHAEYHDSEYQKIGEKTDKGAAEALTFFADAFRSDARYATATDQRG